MLCCNQRPAVFCVLNSNDPSFIFSLFHLLTCDNNQKLWGTEFCGLEVKPPESLNTISEDCMILICNIYYREIEQQLRDMRINNRIEFFSDEYMPSFYFHRLERG